MLRADSKYSPFDSTLPAGASFGTPMSGSGAPEKLLQRLPGVTDATRRGLLTILAAGAATVAGGGMALASSVSDDADLLILVEEFFAQGAERNRRYEEVSAAQELWEDRHPEPATLRYTLADRARGLPEPWNGRESYRAPCDIGKLQRMKQGEVNEVRMDSMSIADLRKYGTPYLPVPIETYERLTEIIAAHDAWTAERNSDMPDFQTMEAEICDSLDEIHGQVVDAVATTPEGFAAKLRCIRYHLGSAGMEIAEALGEGGPTSEIAASVLRDLETYVAVVA
jgi:hypothetical protein